MTLIKAFAAFWQPRTEPLAGILRIERVWLERRRQATMRRQALLRIRFASLCSAIEQIDHELGEIEKDTQ